MLAVVLTAEFIVVRSRRIKQISEDAKCKTSMNKALDNSILSIK